jgi:hypothetical protein
MLTAFHDPEAFSFIMSIRHFRFACDVLPFPWLLRRIVSTRCKHRLAASTV